MEIKSNITGGKVEKIFSTKIMNKYDISYYKCKETGALQVEKPFWLDEAYASPMNLTDTGVIFRNQIFLERVGTFLFFLFGSDANFLDYAGGYGIFTRMMRDAGFNYYWDDPYTKNLLSRGFEYDGKIKISALTAFETFEHLVEPYEEIEKMLKITQNVIFSTQMVPSPTPQPEDWWYYGLEHGQHVSLYTPEALQYIADKLELKFYTNGVDLHTFLDNTIFPKYLPSKWMDELNQLTNKAFKKSFQKVEINLGSFKRNAYHKYKYGNIFKWIGDKAEADKLLDALTSTNFMNDFVKHILNEGHKYWPAVRLLTESKTFSDMLMIRDRLLKQTNS